MASKSYKVSLIMELQITIYRSAFDLLWFIHTSDSIWIFKSRRCAKSLEKKEELKQRKERRLSRKRSWILCFFVTHVSKGYYTSKLLQAEVQELQRGSRPLLICFERVVFCWFVESLTIDWSIFLGGWLGRLEEDLLLSRGLGCLIWFGSWRRENKFCWIFP